ncbi:hypothetical protein F5B21DRAFT_511806 [Xylaria acuta]|nr:hypothetical protein F5B21DRAFT_511806 [Xylaria acuta]
MVPQRIIPRSKRTMLGMAIIGILLAVGHHLFYRNLMGKEPPDSIYPVLGNSISLTGQQINLTVGTLLAFLVKAFLGNAVSTAHEQHVWRATSLDTHLQRVPRIDFTSMNFANAQAINGLSPWHFYDSPQFDVQRVVTASATASQILPITPPHANSSWLLNFHAPALSCQTVGDTLLGEVRGNILDAMVADNCTHSYGYLSWVPASQLVNASLPFDYDSDKQSYSLRSVTFGPNNTNAYRNDPASWNLPPQTLSLFVATLPKMVDNLTPNCDSVTAGDKARAIAQVAGSTVAQCFLYNASYIVNFDYVDGVQHVAPAVNGSYNDVSGPFDVTGAQPFLAMFPNGSYVPTTVNGTPTSFNTTLVETYSFAAVMESFGNVLIGSISSTPMGLEVTSGMASTALLNTMQLEFLNTFYLQDAGSFESLPSYQWNGLSVSKPVNFTADWLETVEKMFQNATVSLMESDLLRPNYSSPYAPLDTLVTIMSYKNTYVYSIWILWVPYGVAIGFALIAITLGTLSALRNGASYTTKFSTVLRVAHTLSLSSPVGEKDVSGEDPTPDNVSRIIIAFPTGKSDDGLTGYEAEGMTTSNTGLLRSI